eukprot:CAMPEP_0194482410 /NCGR_PEP_ID=MMETSP0253-20130528/4373_1 /TAXON_ID=2966 /ORGANISM="Noctiluca scintillans" /LENGTH=160 /DNA_ID=CAMNT_0039321947 /DNA_START=59 /DNA_END=541 /DNA_ORIENTATION=+
MSGSPDRRVESIALCVASVFALIFIYTFMSLGMTLNTGDSYDSGAPWWSYIFFFLVLCCCLAACGAAAAYFYVQGAGGFKQRSAYSDPAPEMEPLEMHEPAYPVNRPVMTTMRPVTTVRPVTTMQPIGSHMPMGSMGSQMPQTHMGTMQPPHMVPQSRVV